MAALRAASVKPCGTVVALSGLNSCNHAHVVIIMGFLSMEQQ
jgi:hypothetical protein